MLLYEQNAFREAPQIDRENGVIRNVKILGTVSRNGRTYIPEALKAAVPKYEKKVVNINHMREDSESNRQVQDGFGRLENVVVKNDELFGDLQFLKSHPIAERVCEAAERMPEQFGLSHNAQGTMEGKKVVSIDHVYSVDLVRYPATVNSLFESQKELKEIDSDFAVPIIPPDGSDSVSAMDSIKSGFRAAIMDVLNSDMDVDEMKTRIGQLLDAGASAVETLATEESDMSSTDTKDKDAEQLQEQQTDQTDLKDELAKLTEAVTGIKSQVETVNKAVLLERVIGEQNIDRRKLEESQLTSLLGAENYEDMVAEAEKLPANCRAPIRIQERSPVRPKTKGSYDSMREELELT